MKYELLNTTVSAETDNYDVTNNKDGSVTEVLTDKIFVAVYAELKDTETGAIHIEPVIVYSNKDHDQQTKDADRLTAVNAFVQDINNSGAVLSETSRIGFAIQLPEPEPEPEQNTTIAEPITERVINPFTEPIIAKLPEPAVPVTETPIEEQIPETNKEPIIETTPVKSNLKYYLISGGIAVLTATGYFVVKYFVK